VNGTPAYTFAIPTYRRPDVLKLALSRIGALDYDLSRVEVIVLDNGEGQNTAAVGKKFVGRLPLAYHVNPKNLGPGGSLNRGLALARGGRIVIMNDDALIPPDFLRACDAVFDTDPVVGCLGCRAVEKGYVREGRGVGRITKSGKVIGNFDVDTRGPVEVEHIYGFCYVITREALERAGPFDTTLLARPYASGNRIETDHCLSIRRAGLKVVYDSRLVVEHLAKPRLDIDDRSLRWRVNDVRNTLYLFLKHFGWLGRSRVALRYGLLHDLGIRSALLKPTRKNWAYFGVGVQARASAVWHYILYLFQCPGPGRRGGR
jgi:GT2 family glycosyltransferase